MAGPALAQGSKSTSPVFDRKPWDQSVPLNPETSPSKSSSPQDSSNSQPRNPRQPLSNNTNGNLLHQKSSRSDMPQLNGPKGSRVEALTRRENNLNNLSRSGSEPDSLLDLYKQNGDKQGDSQILLNEDEDPESAKWIHRDKLARIESEELQRAGIRLPPQNETRSTSKASRRTRSRDRSNSSPADQAEQWPTQREEKRQKVSSPIPTEEEERETWDLRTPEEIAADPYETGSYKNMKKSSSRIPVLTSSPVPVPQEHIERDTPLPRTRNTSGSWSREEEGIAYRGRGRSQSDTSRNAIDDIDINGSPTTPPGSARSLGQMQAQGSPTKPKAAKAAGASTGGRKTSSTAQKRTSLGPNKSTTTSVTSSARPVTRGNDGRPSTAMNRPEGDPPWLATMYKPDPRLPPDQQILPTHARRMQQEQWEKEGKYGTTFDREFSPLAVHTQNGLKQPLSPNSTSFTDFLNGDDSNAWPLKGTLRTVDPNNHRPGTSGTDHGGYSTMPKVQNTPPVGMAPSPKPVQGPMKTTNSSSRPPPPREEDDEDGKVSKGCGCCTVM